MAIDGKPTRAWAEEDLRELCQENRREGARLDFKRELPLSSDTERKDAEHDAQAMANGSGGVIIYGIDEVTLDDGTVGAGSLCPLQDGSLYERLNSLLDDRGQPRLVFELYAIAAAEGGTYLVLDVSGRRRPHMAQDGRYYMRRGTSSRRMQEPEVGEAYRDKLLRDTQAIEPLRSLHDGSGLPDIAQRVHRGGLKPAELALWREEMGEDEPPGWMSVVVYPEPPQPELLDPIRDRDLFQSVEIPERWDTAHAPFHYFYLQATLNSLRSQLPPTDERAPAYLIEMWRDGVCEYGSTLEPGLRHDDPADNRVIFTESHVVQAHDYLQAFAVVLGELGYDGPVAAQVSFEHAIDIKLGIDWTNRMPPMGGVNRINEEAIRSPMWRGERVALLDAAGLIVKDVMDRAFLAAGLSTGAWMIAPTGEWVG